MHDEPIFLLRTIGLGPELVLLGQERTADEGCQLLVARRHQLQGWRRIRKSQRASATFVRAVGMNLGVHAPIHYVTENVVFEEIHGGVVVGTDEVRATFSRKGRRKSGYPAPTAFLRQARCTAQVQPGGCERSSFASISLAGAAENAGSF